jgi:CheY-like chemotaxis protein
MTDRKVLVVDDYNDNLTLMQMILEKDGWTVLVARDGSDVLQTTLTEEPDVIVMDINMPELGGLEVCRQIKAHPHTADVPVIIFTTYFGPGIKDRAFDAGAVEFTNSPFVPSELRYHVNRAYHKGRG